MKNKYGKLVVGLSLVLMGLLAGNSGVVVYGVQTALESRERMESIEDVGGQRTPEQLKGESYESVQ